MGNRSAVRHKNSYFAGEKDMTGKLNSVARLFCRGMLLCMAVFMAAPLLAQTVTPGGTFSHSLDIELPPGTAGLMPKLSLVYDSGNSVNGRLGLGFDLQGISYITRDNSHPLRYDGTDHYTTESDRLVCVNSGEREYHTENESFVKFIESTTRTGDGPESWTAYSPDGMLLFYGTTGDSRIEALDQDGSVRVWALSRVEDAHGNYYTIEYDERDGEWYPTRIVYTRGDDISEYRVIEFSYEGRSDTVIKYDFGTRVETLLRLREISIHTGVTEIFSLQTGGDLVHRYEIEYAPVTESRVERIREFDANNEEQPSTTLDWEGDDTLAYDGYYETIAHSLVNGRKLVTADFDGDGVTDAMSYSENTYSSGGDPETSTYWTRFEGFRWHINDMPVFGSLHFNHYSNGTIAQNMGDDGVIETGDWNADGRTDLLWYNTATGQNVWFINQGISGSTLVFTVVDDLVSRNIVHKNGGAVIQGDWNGDGLTDIMWFNRGSGSNYWYLNKWNGTSLVFAQINPLDPISREAINDDGVLYAGDWNGDGLTDVMWIQNWSGKNRWYINRGLAPASNGISFDSSPNPISGGIIDDGGFYIVDWNGDGLTDAVWYGKVNHTYYTRWFVNKGMHSSGISFDFYSGPNGGAVIPDPAIDDPVGAHFFFADYNGDGRGDALWYNNCTGDMSYCGANRFFTVDRTSGGHLYAGRRLVNGADPIDHEAIDEHGGLRFGDWNGDGILDLMWFNSDDKGKNRWYVNSIKRPRIREVHTDSGAVFKVEYKSSVEIAAAPYASQKQYPYAPNPAPRMLVSRTTTGDGRGAEYTKSYQYGQAFVKLGPPYARTDLGFSWVRENDEGAGTYTVSEYEQDDAALAGAVKKSVTCLANGTPLREHTYSYSHLNSVETRFNGVACVRPSGEREMAYEGGAPLFTSEKSFEYNEYGAITKSVESDGTATIVADYTYDIDESAWLLSRPREVKKTSNGIILVWDRYTYAGTLITRKERYLNEATWVVTSYEYDGHGNPIIITDPLGVATHIGYDETYKCFPVVITNAAGHTLKREYDARFGKIAWEEDANGNRTSNEYDGLGRPLKLIEPGDSWTRSWVYHEMGNPAAQYAEERVKDDASPLGYRAAETYVDGLGREYRKVTVFAGDSAADRYKQTVEKEYDAAGRVSRESVPYITGCDTPRYTVYQYDAQGRVMRKTHPQGNGYIFETFAYEAANGRLKVTRSDVVGNAHVTEFDAAGNMRRREDPLGAFINYDYDPLRKLVRTTDAKGNVTAITYDALGRKTSIKDPNTGLWTYSYDNAGRLVVQTDAREVALARTYDALGRVTRENSSDGTIDTHFSYDDTAKTNAKGRLTGVTDETGDTTFAYNAKGQPSATVKTIDGMDFAFGMEYDSQKRLTKLTYPDGKAVERRYSSHGFLKEVLHEGESIVQYGRAEGETSNWCTSRVVKRRTGNGVETAIHYNEETLRPTSITSSRVDSSNQNIILEQVNYSYDNAGNITALEDVQTPANTERYDYDALGRLTRAQGAYGDRSYAYDTQGNLTQKDGYTQGYSDPLHPHALTSDGRGNTYAYDANGNMTTRKRRTLAYDAKNRLGSVGVGAVKLREYTYDYSGFRVKKWNVDGSTLYNINGLYEVAKALFTNKEMKYVYGMEGDLAAQVPSRGGQGARIGLFGIKKNMYNWQSPEGLALKLYATTRSLLVEDSRNYHAMMQILLALTLMGCGGLFVYTVGFRKKPFEIAFPQLAHGVPIVLALFIVTFGLTGCEILIPGGNPDTEINYFHPNHLGSVKMVTNSGGEVIANYKYAPYGELLTAYSSGTDVSKYKYTGQEEDEETGLYYYKARFYDPAVGRFVSADTIMPDAKDTQAFSRYAYVKNNPMINADPTGHLFVLFHAMVTLIAYPVIAPALIAKSIANIIKHPMDWKAWTSLVIDMQPGMLAHLSMWPDIYDYFSRNKDQTKHATLKEHESKENGDKDFWNWWEDQEFDFYKIHAAQDRATSSHYHKKYRGMTSAHMLGDISPLSILYASINTIRVGYGMKPLGYSHYEKQFPPTLIALVAIPVIFVNNNRVEDWMNEEKHDLDLALMISVVND
ncbi:MAG: hypothetical protein EPN93_09235 [Spirochaetes bacterium]|nr:MAG: hypothetical protein EPN93_09235 [Spirochaetota bacterium]